MAKSRFTKAKMARVLEAAQKAGATKVEVRLGDRDVVIVHLTADNTSDNTLIHTKPIMI
jgi:hypothetical protein